VRFFADAMLGRLARWLRIAGCDTAYEDGIADAELARRALEESRVLLTRDRRLLDEWRVPRALLVESEALPEQLRQVAGTFELDWRARLFTRCSRCNALLEQVSMHELGARLPPRVRSETRRFLHCPLCDRVYWRGSHTARMRRVLEDALG
jgi:uncharacterized protein with PIN domain